jgi:GNAT superfamily N-acetyltransferase
MTGQGKESFPFSDLTLARRLERAEAESCARFVEARVGLFPESGAQWIEVAGAYAMFDTVASPVTQTFGLGMFEPVTSDEMDKIEEFYHQRGAPVFHEVSPLADPGLLTLLNERGYRPIELTSVLYRPIDRDLSLSVSRNERIVVRPVREGEQDLWARITAEGWSELPELTDFLLEIGQISSQRAGGTSFFAELDGRPIATGALSIVQGVAHLAGACTIPEGRRQGAQLALLENRLRYAADQGCDIAMMGALPGSASQRNAERHGFRIAYTRIKWQLTQI